MEPAFPYIIFLTILILVSFPHLLSSFITALLVVNMVFFFHTGYFDDLQVCSDMYLCFDPERPILSFKNLQKGFTMLMQQRIMLNVRCVLHDYSVLIANIYSY